MPIAERSCRRRQCGFVGDAQPPHQLLSTADGYHIACSRTLWVSGVPSVRLNPMVRPQILFLALRTALCDFTTPALPCLRWYRQFASVHRSKAIESRGNTLLVDRAFEGLDLVFVLD